MVAVQCTQYRWAVHFKIIKRNFNIIVISSCSVTKSRPTLCDHKACQVSCLSLSPGVCPDSCPLNRWYHPTISSSATLFSSSPKSFPASGSDESTLHIRWPKYWSFSFSITPVNTQGWFPLGLSGLVSLLSKGLSRVFSSTTVREHQFFSTQPSLWSNSHIHTWLLEKS